MSAFTLGKLRQNGIKVRLETTARKADADAAHRTSGEAIETGMIVGTVGAQLGLQHPVSTEHRSAPAVGKAGGGGDPPQAGRGRLMNQKDNHEHST
ncbi:MAG TPA: hypothetical protein VL200_12740 [Lacunisphaera sp.]|nr:hypothetical protein [Lacunisphaera sp.]